MCHQSVGLLARYLETRGLPTVTLSIRRGLTERVRPPRALVVPAERGQTAGPPGDRTTQRARVLGALRLLHGRQPAGRPVLWEAPA